MEIEDRKLRYLLKKSKMTMEGIDSKFKDIDERMKRVAIGMTMVDTVSGVWDDFPVVVTGIIDKDNGIVSVFEPGCGVNGAHREMSISCLSFEDEPRDMKI
jgi:hypothetical protein